MNPNIKRVLSAVLGLTVGLLVAVVFFADFNKDDENAGDNKSKAEKVYVPYGEKDEYYMMASGGHSGQLFVYGLPSMRKIRTVPVFTPDPQPVTVSSAISKGMNNFFMVVPPSSD